MNIMHSLLIQSVENSSVLATDFNVVYTPDKSGIYGLHVYCGNILLNDGHSFTKEVKPGIIKSSLVYLFSVSHSSFSFSRISKVLSQVSFMVHQSLMAGEVNISLSGVVKFAPKVPKQVKNEVVVQLMDSFYNPLMSQETSLKLEVSSMKNTSGFSNWKFVDNNDGSYTSHYVAEDIGTYQICASFDDKLLSPFPFEVNVYSSKLPLSESHLNIA